MTCLRLAIRSALMAVLVFAAAQAEPQKLFPDDRSLGSPQAPVQIIEYAAPVCPYCAQFAQTVLPEMKKAYIDTGKVHYVLRIFPISQYDGAVAGMATCMPPERYFEFVDLAFKRQDLWDPDGHDIPDVHAGLIKLGGLAGLSPEKVDQCIADEKEVERVNRIAEAGEKTYSIRGVPTLIVDGSVIAPEERDWPVLKTRIDGLLAAKNKKLSHGR